VTASVSAPLHHLVRQTEKYAEGDFSGSVDESRGTVEIRSLSRAFNAMGQAIARTVQDLRQSQQEIVHRLALASEYRDTETGRHIERVSRYAEILARAYGLQEEQCALIREAAPMHDVGKIGVPDAVLLKPGSLDRRERQVIETHTRIGSDILTGGTSPLVRLAQEIAASHHERWDGKGYPKGLKTDEISVAGKIVALCDVFDALTSRRPYKRAFTFEEAVTEIRKGRGTQFDPRLTDLFIQVLPQIREVWERYPPVDPIPRPGFQSP
jgi:putative two-component system response regulator